MNTKHKHTAIYLTAASALVLSSTQVLAQSGNTGYGTNALVSITTGEYNSAFGENALRLTTSGDDNTAIGHASLFGNTTGYNNTASGYVALYSNTTGYSNTATGYASLYVNTSGYENTASGYYALRSNTTGYENTASGAFSLFSNTTGDFNIASGSNSLYSNTTGYNNTASGYASLYANTTAHENTAIGYVSLTANTEGVGNTAIGAWALADSTTGFYNTASGYYALRFNTEGKDNVAIGNSALYNNTTGSNNLAIGTAAGYGNETGSNNFFMGFNAGFYETGSNKLYIASNGDTPLLYGEMSINAADNKLGIGTNFIAPDSVISVWNGASLSLGGVWTNASSRELKDDIETLSTEDANAALAALSPVRYVYKNSREEEYVGFIAEDVPDLVATNDRKSLSPMDIVAVLTTVTKDQSAQLTAQQAKMSEKDAEIAALRESLEQQASNIQKQEGRMLQMEMAMAEVLRHQTGEVQVSLSN